MDKDFPAPPNAGTAANSRIMAGTNNSAMSCITWQRSTTTLLNSSCINIKETLLTKDSLVLFIFSAIAKHLSFQQERGFPKSYSIELARLADPIKRKMRWQFQ